VTEQYVPPTISRELGQDTESAAASRNFYTRDMAMPALAALPALSEIDGVAVSALVREFGSPLFVFSEQDIQAKARQMKEAFRSRYPNTSFAWSVKTNYLNAICQILRNEGWIAEVVSEFEYRKVRKLGFPGKEVVFNGPHKPPEILATAVSEGALVQVDNLEELGHLEELAKHAREPVEIGLRVWLDAGVRPIWSKFGFALANGEAERVAIRVAANPKLRLHTLHCHIGTFILAPAAYRVATQKLVALREQIHAKTGHLVACLNLGGGFPSRSLLHGMTGPADKVVPPIEDYADAITQVLNRLPVKKRPLLRLESGRSLVDEAGHLLTTVVSVKGINHQLNGGGNSDLSARDHKERLLLNEHSKVGYVVDAGINLLYTAAWYQFDVRPAQFVDSPPIPSRLYGPLCMAIDVIRDDVDLPSLKAGDLLTLHPVGAYNVVQSMQFISYRPAVVLIGANGKPELIRTRETLEDIDRPERLPAHLLEA
jgi:diaminopimelate decarboxylase